MGLVRRGAVVAMVLACSSPPREVAPVTPEALRVAPTLARHEGTSLGVSVEAWRSFQPLAGDAGDSLIVVARVTGDRALPEDLVVEALHVLRGVEAWRSTAAEEHAREAGTTEVEFVARNGPRWAPGDSIDVVLALRTRGAAPFLLRAPRVAIARVD